MLTRAEAKASGLKRYVSDKPCRNGHVGDRIVSNNRCYACLRILTERWRQENPDKDREARKEYWARYYQSPGVKERIANHKRVARSDDDAKRTRCEYVRGCRANDPAFRLNGRMRSRMYQMLKGGKAGRSWMALAGYDTATLMRHLERQFTKGMGWQNMGEWHVDHIRPLSSFSLDRVAEAWALTNLRPLWSSDNVRKGAKRVHLL